MPKISKNPRVSTVNIDENGVVYYTKFNRAIGKATSNGLQEVSLHIKPYNLVNAFWPRQNVISFYRNLAKVVKDIKARGFYITGGVWFPNLEKETLNQAYDIALASSPGLEEPKAEKRTYKPRKPKGVVSGQEETREVALAGESQGTC